MTKKSDRVEPKSGELGVINECPSRIPVRFRRLYQLCMAKIASPRQAIKAKCASCMGYECVSERIQSCLVRDCPLLRYRPYQKGTPNGLED